MVDTSIVCGLRVSWPDKGEEVGSQAEPAVAPGNLTQNWARLNILLRIAFDQGKLILLLNSTIDITCSPCTAAESDGRI